MTIFWEWGNILVNNYQSEFQQGFVEVETTAGIPCKKQHTTDIQKIFQGSFTLTKAEKLSFENWYRNTIKQGTLTFQYYDSEVDAYRTTRIIGNPTITSNSNLFNVNVQLIFDSGIFFTEKYLTVGAGLRSLVNPDKPLVVNKKLRL